MFKRNSAFLKDGQVILFPGEKPTDYIKKDLPDWPTIFGLYGPENIIRKVIDVFKSNNVKHSPTPNKVSAHKSRALFFTNDVESVVDLIYGMDDFDIPIILKDYSLAFPIIEESE